MAGGAARLRKAGGADDGVARFEPLLAATRPDLSVTLRDVASPRPPRARVGASPIWERLVPLWESTDSGWFVYDQDCRLAYYNPAFTTITGTRPSVGCTEIVPLVIEESRSALARCYARLRVATEPQAVDLKLATTVGSESRILRVLVTALAEGSQSATCLVGEVTKLDDAPGSPENALGDRLAVLERALGRIRLEVAGVAQANPSETVRVESIDELSPRELTVLRRLALGLRAVDIASELKLSRNTVRNHMKAVYRKLGVHSQAELTARLWASDEKGVVTSLGITAYD